jgi:organic hydroperoxide reductase OsmC/OhrA
MTTHSYELFTAWTGNRGTGTSGYRDYARTYEISGTEKPLLLGSADPTFRGDADRYNPEELLLAALSACHLLSYLHVCADAGVVVTGYEDDPTGAMEVDRAGKGAFTEAVLRPRVRVASEDMVDRAFDLHHDAHDLCFIANSVGFPVRHEPTVFAQPF